MIGPQSHEWEVNSKEDHYHEQYCPGEAHSLAEAVVGVIVTNPFFISVSIPILTSVTLDALSMVLRGTYHPDNYLDVAWDHGPPYIVMITKPLKCTG